MDLHTFEKDGMIFYNILQNPFRIYGLMRTSERYVRMDPYFASKTSANVSGLNSNTAGGRVRFTTDSERIAIIAKMDCIGKMSHFALTGSAGFDLYAGTRFWGSFIPPFDITDGYSSCLSVCSGMKDITINFPLYSGVRDLFVGIDKNSVLKKCPDYRYEKPVLYYGSSITQGGCASRPGNSYQAVISRNLDCNYINLGFSGSARGEDAIAEYIASLDYSVFVYDYDYNAPDPDHLRKTHEKMFLKIRDQHPDTPIIIVTAPKLYQSSTDLERKAVISSTYLKSVANGDKNVYFVDGTTFYELFGGDSCSVDNCHPTDLGFMCMAKSIGSVIKDIFLLAQ